MGPSHGEVLAVFSIVLMSNVQAILFSFVSTFHVRIVVSTVISLLVVGWSCYYPQVLVWSAYSVSFFLGSWVFVGFGECVHSVRAVCRFGLGWSVSFGCCGAVSQRSLVVLRILVGQF